MTGSGVRRLARSLIALAVALAAAGAVVSVVDGNRTASGDAFIWVIMLTFAIAGHVIATRQPGNALGWVFLGVGVSAGLSRLVGAYADYWVATGQGARTLGDLALAYRNVSWIPFILVPATFLLLLFPDGRLLSRRWRPVAWCAVVGIAGGGVSLALAPGELDDHPGVDNPLGVDSPAIDALTTVTLLLLMVGMVGSAVSLVVRFRHARGAERAQMKWLAVAGLVAAVTIPMMFVLYDTIGQVAADSVIMLSVLALPTATAVAIVRYRLYDIDVVINRTLVYGSLTATLAGVYVGSVLLLQLALDDITQGSELAVAASTLAVAALFGPVRGRIQNLVDRRFYRSRFDATQTIQAFGSRLRDEVDLSALSGDLQAVVRETMRPTHVSLWLRDQESA